MSSSRFQSKNEADEAVSVVSLISSSVGYILMELNQKSVDS